jgi:hypothetical protein
MFLDNKKINGLIAQGRLYGRIPRFAIVGLNEMLVEPGLWRCKIFIGPCLQVDILFFAILDSMFGK